MSKPHDLTAFRGGASYFDTPMGYIFPRLLCSFPKAKIVHTTRKDYHRGYDGSSRKCRSKREYRLESDLARCIEYGSTCPTRDEAARAFAVNERAMLSVPKSRRHIMNISNLSSIHAGPLAGFLGKEWRWGNPDNRFPTKPSTTRPGRASVVITHCIGCHECTSELRVLRAPRRRRRLARGELILRLL